MGLTFFTTIFFFLVYGRDPGQFRAGHYDLREKEMGHGRVNFGNGDCYCETALLIARGMRSGVSVFSFIL